MGHLVRLSYSEAPSGSFAITGHGTGTAATAYSDYDCQTVTNDRTLNASGRRNFYVTDSVDVTVYNSFGVSVDSFTESVRAELVDVHSLSWTGSNPDGTSGLGGSLSLSSLLTSLASSFGSANGYVKETGQATALLLKDALANVRTANLPYYNVKSAPYNAAGNGTTNDTTAIQAAITACSTAGGGIVYIPRGTYLVTTSLSIANINVALLGDGAASIVQYTGISGTRAFSFTGTGAQTGNSISRVNVYASGTGGLVDSTNNPGFRIDSCSLRTASTGAGVISVNSDTYISNCYIDVPLTSAVGRGVIENTTTTAGNAVVAIGNVASAQLTAPDACLIAATSTANTPRIVSIGNVARGNSVYAIGVNTTNAAGSYYAVGNAAGAIRVFSGSAGGTYVEAANDSGILFDSTTGTPTVVSTYSMSRSVDRGTQAATVSPSSLSSDEYVDLTATPIAVSAPTTACWDGHELVLRLRNTTGGAVTVNWNAAFLGTGGMGTIASGATRVARFIRKNSGTTPGWRYAGHWDTT